MDKIDHTKFAVENVHVVTGDRVRVMETPQEWTAKLICDTAKKAFKASSRPYTSEWFQITDENGKPVTRGVK